MITPTVGRVVWYRPSEWDVGQGMATDYKQPFVALVAYVHTDHLVNLVVWDHNGTFFSRAEVRLKQGDEILPDNSGYAEWMPYQKGQAAKAEALEKKLETQS
jgi:hypothetical protein